MHMTSINCTIFYPVLKPEGIWRRNLLNNTHQYYRKMNYLSYKKGEEGTLN